MRSKEEAHDYRYFPDPDLLPLEFDQAYVDASPRPARAAGRQEGSLHRRLRPLPYDAAVLVAERASADYFEAVAKGRDGKAAANWVINELFGRLNKEGLGIEESPVTAAQLGGIVDLIAEGVISGKIAKDLFEIVWSEAGSGPSDPRALVESRGLRQVTDTGAIEAAVDRVIAENPDKVAQAKAKPTLAGWFVGQVMKATGGKAAPAAVNALVKAKLGIE
jgi:aspartyl-tRNA(Asn)/glutamyl-tRNA(Gln) amidotransferase subunit B